MTTTIYGLQMAAGDGNVKMAAGDNNVKMNAVEGKEMAVVGEPKAATATLLCVGYGRESLLELRKRKQEQQGPASSGVRRGVAVAAGNRSGWRRLRHQERMVAIDEEGAVGSEGRRQWPWSTRVATAAVIFLEEETRVAVTTVGGRGWEQKTSAVGERRRNLVQAAREGREIARMVDGGGREERNRGGQWRKRWPRERVAVKSAIGDNDRGLADGDRGRGWATAVEGWSMVDEERKKGRDVEDSRRTDCGEEAAAGGRDEDSDSRQEEAADAYGKGRRQ
ncbi:hypothetical protein BHM03_00062432 [Ensete ventricosum]|nr:hypothetical protein BHM03_00062432 [Ensete ventricosum]